MHRKIVTRRALMPLPLDGLCKQLAVFVATTSHTAATAGGAPAGDRIGMLADVLGSIDDRAGALAEYADRARIAGQQCERDYHSLSVSSR
ncbi:DUF2514 family protein [Burkholderia cepacia]|uniref:Gp56 n=1 Tax=Burkholderia cepacia GG4 TaxID=1009846 RepID=A0A9W3P9C0_BURCE|nr:DUF2514 family protein [Burkholderia cepacia]AFQ48280.1 gp56 [Burkholderia cepacia GG4]